MIQTNITITLSKIMAFTLLAGSIALDIINTKSATAFMFAVPFISALVLGKQGLDILKQKVGQKGDTK